MEKMHNRMIAGHIVTLAGLLKEGYVKFEDPKEYLEWCQQVVAGIYTGYLYSLGESERIDPKKEMLIAQTFINTMHRGLIDLINTVPDPEDDTEEMYALNEDFDDEFLPEVDDGK